MSAAPFAQEPDCLFGAQTLIWIPQADAKGTVAEPVFVAAAYANQVEFFQYRADELTDPSARADLLEQAVFRASKAEKRAPLDDPERYLFTTYSALVDEELASSVKMLGQEPFLLEYLASKFARSNLEEDLTNDIYRRE